MPGNMLLGSIQISGEHLSTVEVRDICDSLKNNSTRLLSLRGCKIDDEDFGPLATAIGESKSIVQLNLNLGVVSDSSRARLLGEALTRNRSLNSLFLHGSPLGDEGLTVLIPSLSTHPFLTSLDLGDCRLGDGSIKLISALLPPDGARQGIHDLTLSANPAITARGWAQLSVALASSSTIRTLCLDYNSIGDYGAGMLAVVVAGSRTLEVLDMEGTGLTEFGGQVFLDLVQNYPVTLKQLVLCENGVSEETQQQVNSCLSVNTEDTAQEEAASPDPGPSTSATPGRSHDRDTAAAAVEA
ncbi:leucine-rich repeat-containing protein 73-like [Branchiostoma floridae x Branchiostoma japonicum]